MRAKAAAQAPLLVLLAAIERDAFGVLADADHAVAEVGVVALEVEIDPHQRPADQVGQPGADERVDRSPPTSCSREW